MNKFLEVGQGLSFIDVDNSMIYDAGGSITKEDYIKKVYTHFPNKGIHINIVISHLDHDHIKYVGVIMEEYPNSKFWLKNSNKFIALEIKFFHDLNKQSRIIWVSDVANNKVGDYELKIQNHSRTKDPNNNSIVAINDKLKILLTGDISYKFMRKILDLQWHKYSATKFEIFQIPHHGSKAISSTGHPSHLGIESSKAFVTFGKPNSYGHPKVGPKDFPLVTNYKEVHN